MTYAKFQLQNGIIIKYLSLPQANKITLLLDFGYGSAFEEITENGITHLLEHMMFRRNNGMNQGDFYEKIETIGTGLRGVTNYYNVIFEETTTSEMFAELVDIMAGFFNENGWTEEDLGLEKAVVNRQIAMTYRNNHYLTMEAFWNDEKISKPIIGKTEKIAEITLIDLKNHKEKVLNPNHTEVILTGNFTEKDLQVLIDEFSGISVKESFQTVKLQPEKFMQRSVEDEIIYSDEEAFSHLTLCFDVDLAKISMLEMKFLQSMLFTGLVNPFSLQLREKLALIDEVDSYSFAYDFGGYLYVHFICEQSDLARLIEEIKQIFQEELKQLNEQNFNITKLAYKREILDLKLNPEEMAYLMQKNSQFTTLENYATELENIDVKHMQEVMKTVISANNLTIFIDDAPMLIKNLAKVESKLEDLRKVLN